MVTMSEIEAAEESQKVRTLPHGILARDHPEAVQVFVDLLGDWCFEVSWFEEKEDFCCLRN